MNTPCGRPGCPQEERRKTERRAVVRTNFAWCARVMGFSIVATSLLSIASAVTISSHQAERKLNQERRITDFHQQQYLSLSKRVSALENRVYEP